jgi:hypothetical protein
MAGKERAMRLLGAAKGIWMAVEGNPSDAPPGIDE